MKIFLVRHGHINSEDAEKRLSPSGVQQVERLAQWCREHAVTPHEIRYSPTARTRQTAEILARVLTPPGGLQEVEAIGIDGPAETLAAELADIETELMLVTHQPFIARLSEILLDRAGIQLNAAGILALNKTVRGWQVLHLYAP